MTVWSLYSVGQLLWSSFSLATVVGIGAAAVAVFLPPLPWFLAGYSSHLRTIAIYVAIGAFSFSTVAGKFYHDGLVVKQHEWDRAKEAEAVSGEKARSDSERDIRDDTPDDVRRDPRNRDNWK